jgi:pyruvate dehydrogenase (quinone)
MTKNIAELMVDVRAGAAVERVYGLSGDSLNGFTDAICKQEQIRWIHVRSRVASCFPPWQLLHFLRPTGKCLVRLRVFWQSPRYCRLL